MPPASPSAPCSATPAKTSAARDARKASTRRAQAAAPREPAGEDAGMATATLLPLPPLLLLKPVEVREMKSTPGLPKGMAAVKKLKAAGAPPPPPPLLPPLPLPGTVAHTAL